MSSDTKHIYLVRHGESRANAGGVFEGADSPLTPEGIAQAQSVAERFSRIPIEIVLTSHMVRAEHTGRIIAERNNVPMEVIEHAGEQLRQKEAYGVSKLDERFKHFEQSLWNAFALGKDTEGAETFAQLQARAVHVQGLLEQRPEQRIVLATHGNFLKFFMYHVLMQDLLTSQLMAAMSMRMRTKNTGITYFTFDTDKGWQLHAWNDHAHLG